MPYADFFEYRRSGLLALLERIEEGDRDELDYISSKIYTDTRNDSVPIYDLSCFGAIMSLCHADWMEAESGRLLTAHAYVLQRAAAATLNPNAIENIDEELPRGFCSSTGLFKVGPRFPGARVPYTGPIGDVTEMRLVYRDLGYAHKINEFDTYPERVMNDAPLRKAWEERARRLIDEGLIGQRQVNMDTFGREFYPYYNVRPGDTISNVVIAKDSKGIPQVVDATIVSGSSTTTNDQQNIGVGEEDEHQTEGHDQAEVEALERKKAKNRKKNQKRKVNKKAQKAGQQEEEASESHLADHLAENYTLESSDTVVDDSGLIEGVNAR
ncbi:unnamed protein product [Aureobasidium mustum]|uniref:Uncharacterized protein n=1 Tax=Aureobasidium mustum TaxID=2773714 RepID=A0A9N8JLQ4_9PEZI|nr:unnamed protein product [Aureobasidium mustum]